MYLKTALLATTLTFATTALADHNSPMGEGWANMPNDVHNTRIDTKDDNDAFKDFVKFGNGAETVNRFSDTSTTSVSGGRQANTYSTGSMGTSTQSRTGNGGRH